MLKKGCLIIGLFITCISNSQTIQSELEAVFEAYELMGMSVWVGTPGVSEQFHYGLRDLNRDLPINADTKYRIASVSKSVTALGLIKLYNDGLFDLDDDISEYLGYTIRNPQYPDIPITFRMVVSHTSSLQDGDGYNPFLQGTFNQLPVPNISEVLVSDGDYYTTNMWRTETPGTFFAYSNINFGLIGTLIEKISDERFDRYMKNEILDPLGLDASYNVRDLSDINDVAVLYRNNGGWQPQVDNYEGVVPSPPNIGDYTPGTNGIYFGPQGSLRISAEDTGFFLNYLASDGINTSLNISQDILQEMKAIAWNYDSTNGDNYFGLFNRWGLGLHHANVTTGDQICNLGTYDSFIGHPGEAFGLVSDAYFNTQQNISFALLINGIWNGYQLGENSSYYTVEEDVFEVLCTYFQETLTVSDITVDNTVLITPNPANKETSIILEEITTPISYTIYDSKGSFQNSGTLNNKSTTIDISALSRGVYFIKIKNNTTITTRKLLIR
ncbi:serine hydrolase [uncultured Dokdonia sp.]|uniref:serine hydrolase n=1 Tax=uncultured Dokdonia sp. TaxID=575653 RepID=UPI002615AECC|nr:serine hydrolase [uncultured Dokdonia sp.]